MNKFQVFRKDISKVLHTSTKPTAEEAFGEWASAAMISGFINYSDSYRHAGGEKYEVTSAAGKKFEIEILSI
jgi:hypothetical protein